MAYVWNDNAYIIGYQIPHKLLYVDCYNSTQNLITGATVVNFTTQYNHEEALKKYVTRESSESVLLDNRSPVEILEVVSKHFKYTSVVEHTVDRAMQKFWRFDIDGTATATYKVGFDLFGLFFDNFMATATINVGYHNGWNESMSSHDFSRMTSVQEMNSTKKVKVPAFSSTRIDFTAKQMRHPMVPYTTFIKIGHISLNTTQIMAMLKGQDIGDTCLIEQDDVLCKLSGVMKIDASLGLDFTSTGSFYNRTVAHHELWSKWKTLDNSDSINF